MTSNTSVAAKNTSTTATDADELVRRAQRGEDAAFDALVSAFSGRMYNLAYRMTGNADDAADLTQEIFVKLYRAIGKFAWRSSFSTWLYALASNTCRSGLRRLKRISNAEVVHLDAGETAGETRMRRDPVASGAGPSENVERAELMDRIQAVIATLDEDFRLVLVLRDIQDLSYEEIADAVGCSLGTVKSRLARARAKVRDTLVKEGLTCSVTK